MSLSNEIFCVNRNYLNDDIDSSSNEIDLACKYFVNNDDNNFKKELIKLLREGLIEISERLYSIETLI